VSSGDLNSSTEAFYQLYWLKMITKKLIAAIISQYSLPLNGIHGISHWARVLENGKRLAKINHANMPVVQLFAIFHDSKRVNESIDTDHGLKGAEFAASLRGCLFNLNDECFELLRIACTLHTDGLTDGDVTVQTCWDSDRLDLGRIGITPDPRYLCTDAAKNPHIIKWANERSNQNVTPKFLGTKWGYTPD